MASTQPIIRQQAKWTTTLPQLGLLLAISSLFYFFGGYGADSILFGMFTYLFISIFLTQLVPRYHRKGMRYVKQMEFEKAISEFDKSYVFFKQHEWIDKYRWIVLLSSSRASYSEMALINTAYCYGQNGNGTKSREYYEKALLQFPDSQIAQSAIRMIKSVETTSN